MHAGILGCLFGRHQPLRREVRVIDGALVTRCRHCKVPLVQRCRSEWIKDPLKRALRAHEA